MRKDFKKWIDLKEFVGHHQAYIHTHYGSTEREKREKLVERIFEEIMLENFPNFMKYMNL